MAESLKRKSRTTNPTTKPTPRKHDELGPALLEKAKYLSQEEHKWRSAVFGILKSDPAKSFPKPISQTGDLKDRITDILATLRIINQVLGIRYGTPDWGNKHGVIEELVYILLCKRSKIEIAQGQFQALKKAFPWWEELLRSDPRAIKKIIYGGGLEDDKFVHIRGSLLAIKQRFGRISESDLRNLTDDELSHLLLALPGVGPKTASCVLMYARGGDVFPSDTHCIRVLNRLGIFATLGFEWSQSGHKKAQQELAVLIPPGMRADLHRNLVALGKDVCTAQPMCERCELRKFCAHYRTEKREQEEKRHAPTMIDVYSGAGGFSLGFEQVGFKVVAAIDVDVSAVKTYRFNHPEIPEDHVLHLDAKSLQPKQLKKLLGGHRLDVLAGGPPCQGFSTIGKRVRRHLKRPDRKGKLHYDFTKDDRNHLYREMIRLARRLEPRFVVIENVPGLGTARSGEDSFAEIIDDELKAIGYKTIRRLLSAETYGVPQHRHRFFIIAAHPSEKVSDLEKVLANQPSPENRPKLWDAISDLPRLSSDDGKWIAPKLRLKASIGTDTYLRRFCIL